MLKKYTQYNDEELINLLRGKKPESDDAFTEIYKRYAQRVKAYCSVTLNDEYMAADIFQETFIRFYNKARETKMDVFNVPGLLITTARNLCLNAKRNRKNTVPIDELAGYFEAENNSYEKSELWGLITMALDVMDEKYKEVFILRELDNFSIKEIAEITGETVACAKSRVFRAHMKLMEILEPYLTDLEESKKS